jgi:hypothetical protein
MALKALLSVHWKGSTRGQDSRVLPSFSVKFRPRETCGSFISRVVDIPEAAIMHAQLVWSDHVLPAAQVIEDFKVGPWGLFYDDRPPEMALILPLGVTLREPFEREVRTIRYFKHTCATCKMASFVLPGDAREVSLSCPDCSAPPVTVNAVRKRNKQFSLSRGREESDFLLFSIPCLRCNKNNHQIRFRTPEEDKPRKCRVCDDFLFTPIQKQFFRVEDRIL